MTFSSEGRFIPWFKPDFFIIKLETNQKYFNIGEIMLANMLNYIMTSKFSIGEVALKWMCTGKTSDSITYTGLCIYVGIYE